LSVDVLASSEVSVSLTLDKKQKIVSESEILKDLSRFADVTMKQKRAILTLIADVDRSSDVLATVFCVFANLGIKVEMLSQGASKVNISFVLMEEQLVDAVVNLHKCFFEGVCALGERDENNCPVKENLEDIGE
jgi:aspartate kinase